MIGYCEVKGSSLTIEDCFSTASIYRENNAQSGSGDINQGGFIGGLSVTSNVIINNCYSTGRVYV